MQPVRRKRLANSKLWAVIVAVLLHAALVLFAFRVHDELIITAARKPGGALRVSLMAAPKQPVQPPPAPQPRPQVKKPVPQKKVLATHRASPRQIAVADPKPAPEITPVATPQTPPRPEAPAQPAAPATVPLPTHGDAGKNAHLTCDIPAPPYPPSARRLGHEGTVELDVTINTTGRITNARIRKSSGYDELDEAARQAMLSARCEPLIQAGHAVSTTAVQPLSFHLDN